MLGPNLMRFLGQELDPADSPARLAFEREAGFA
jgi:hypothetical protein